MPSNIHSRQKKYTSPPFANFVVPSRKNNCSVDVARAASVYMKRNISEKSVLTVNANLLFNTKMATLRAWTVLIVTVRLFWFFFRFIIFISKSNEATLNLSEVNSVLFSFFVDRIDTT